MNSSKSKCLLLSRTKRAFDVPAIIVRGNKIDFVESASNPDIIFNGRLTWSSHINVIVEKVYAICLETYGVLYIRLLIFNQRKMFTIIFTQIEWVISHYEAALLTALQCTYVVG